MSRRKAGGLAAAIVLGISLVPASAVAAPPQPYVVVLVETESCAATIATVVDTYNLHVGEVYTSALCGFTARLRASDVAKLSADPAVDILTPDTVITSG